MAAGPKNGGYTHDRNFEAIERRETEKRQKDKQNIDETIRTIELDGFKSLFSATTFCGKTFWLSLIVFSLCILCYQLYKTVDDYLSSPTISTFTIKTNDTMSFPILYLCPASLISQAYLNRTPTAERRAIGMKREMSILWDYTEYLATGNLSATFESSHESESASGSGGSTTAEDFQHFWLNSTESLDRHFVHCEFHSFLSHPLRCGDIAREVLDPDYGKCYVIDVNDDLRQTVEGQGLQFVFNVQSDNYPTNPELAPVFNGVYMSIVREFNPSSGDSILLTPGTYTRVDLAAQHQVFMHLPDQQQPCVRTNAPDEDDGDGDDPEDDRAPTFQFRVFNTNYSQQSCKYDCVAREMADVCKCLPPTDASLYVPDVFENKTDGFCRLDKGHLKCIKEKIQNDPTVTARIDQCRSQCYVPCKDWRYDVRTTSMSLYPDGFDPTQPVHDLIYVAVAYSHMEYSKYSQANSMEPDDLVANLGGQIGLWLGGSMMTLVQIPLFLFAFCGIQFFNKTKKVAQRRQVAQSPANSNKF